MSNSIKALLKGTEAGSFLWVSINQMGCFLIVLFFANASIRLAQTLFNSHI